MSLLNKSSNPLISVIVPIYKVEKYLKKCIESLIYQTYKNLEIILIDDGSPDKCPYICDYYANKYPNIIVIHKDNEGLVNARKEGIRCATGDYICYVDGDDWVKDNHFEKIALEIMNSNADIIIHGYTRYSKGTYKVVNNHIESGYYCEEQIKKSIIPTMMSRKPFYNTGIEPCIWGKAFKHSLLLPFQIQVPKEITIGEDVAVSYPAIAAAKSISVILDYGYFYRVNDNSMSRRYQRLSNNVLVLINYLTKWCKYEENMTIIMPQVQDYICYMFYRGFANEVLGAHSIKQAIANLQLFMDNEKIKIAVDRSVTPVKVKMAYKSVESKCKVFPIFMQIYWRLKDNG